MNLLQQAYARRVVKPASAAPHWSLMPNSRCLGALEGCRMEAQTAEDLPQEPLPAANQAAPDLHAAAPEVKQRLAEQAPTAVQG